MFQAKARYLLQLLPLCDRTVLSDVVRDLADIVGLAWSWYSKTWIYRIKKSACYNPIYRGSDI